MALLLIGCVLRPFDSEVIHLEMAPHLLSLEKDVKHGNRTQGHRVTVHYTPAAPHQLLALLLCLRPD